MERQRSGFYKNMIIYGTERVAFRLLQESYKFRNGAPLPIMVAQSTKETNEIEYLTNLTRRKTEITVMKKALGETHTLRAGRSKAEPKIFAPPQTPFPVTLDRQNLIRWRWSLPAPTDPVW